MGDVTQAPAVLEAQTGDAVLVDKAYDSNILRAIIAQIGAIAVIPSNRMPKAIFPQDAIAHKQRNRIEQCFNHLKRCRCRCRCFATRYERRRTIHFKGFAFLAAAMVCLC